MAGMADSPAMFFYWILRSTCSPFFFVEVPQIKNTKTAKNEPFFKAHSLASDD